MRTAAIRLYNTLEGMGGKLGWVAFKALPEEFSEPVFNYGLSLCKYLNSFGSRVVELQRRFRVYEDYNPSERATMYTGGALYLRIEGELPGELLEMPKLKEEPVEEPASHEHLHLDIQCLADCFQDILSWLERTADKECSLCYNHLYHSVCCTCKGKDKFGSSVKGLGKIRAELQTIRK